MLFWIWRLELTSMIWNQGYAYNSIANANASLTTGNTYQYAENGTRCPESKMSRQNGYSQEQKLMISS